jgi:glycine/D-amino acid oxidase-like deaminating enzyme
MPIPSFWGETLTQTKSRETLHEDLVVDVAIAGAGFTGLWTAYYLIKQNPSLSIAVLEKNQVGFGASGRNGGWCSALFATSLEKLAKNSSRSAAINQYQAMVDTLDEIAQVITDEKISADWTRGGTVTLARDQIQLKRAMAEINHLRSWGFGEDYLQLLNKEQALGILQASKVYGATFTPHCAAINPAKLVTSLAQVIEGLGVKIFENTEVIDFSAHKIKTTKNIVSANYTVKALEGFSPTLNKFHREVVPVYSLMIATEPLSNETWDQLGLKNRETFADFRNTIIYGQRTQDGRIAFGGRGAPYHFGSQVNPKFDLHKPTHNDLEKTLKELFPILKDVQITHKWGGPLAISRDWSAQVSFDESTGFASAGGYVGDGVGSSNLAGRTLADLILKNKTPLTQLPWVNHHSRNWEVEPIRFIGINLGNFLAKTSDRFESGKSKSSIFSKILSLLIKK